MKRLTALAACCLLALACNNGGDKVTLTKLTNVSSDTKCPNGGVKITAGADKNGNGQLDDSEVTQTEELCNGAPGAAGQNGQNGNDGDAGATGYSSLAVTTPLPAGDAHCPNGGTEVQFGLDNGANGGTAGDGVLQSGEVLDTNYVCNGTLPYYPADVTPPTAPAGQYVMHALGGAGLDAAGATGGNVALRMGDGSLGGAVAVYATGSVDAGFSLPAAPSFTAGAVPMSVSSNLTLNYYGDVDAGLGSGDPFFRVENDSRLWANQSGAAAEVTSLQIGAGATLTVPIAPNAPNTEIRLRNDLVNKGTVVVGTVPSTPNGGVLTLSASTVVGDPGSAMKARGADVDGGVGGTGGNLNLTAGATLLNQGTLDVSGGSGYSAGRGGTVNVNASAGALYNTGDVHVEAGQATNGNGGAGGTVYFFSYLGLYNSGSITANAGAGWSGEPGGTVQLQNSGWGVLRSAGAITARGGVCTGGECNSGRGGVVSLTGRSTEIFHSATIDVSGAGGASFAAGGTGGSITINSNEGQPINESISLPTGSVHVSGDLLANGGSGLLAGTGGNISVLLDPRNVPRGQSLEALGYTELDTSGGDGQNNSGGQGGNIYFTTNVSYPPVEANGGAPSGPVVNYAALKARGGAGTVSGYGGAVNVFTQLSYDFGQKEEVVKNFGAIDVSSADAASGGQGSQGGYVWMEGVSGLENHGTITATGASATGSQSSGGNGGTVQLFCDTGLVTNVSAVNTSGGGGDLYGGTGGSVQLNGDGVNNSGALTSNGGNATTTGGAGGNLQLLSGARGPTVSTGAFSVAGGTGTTAGTKGAVTVDGVDVTP